MKPSSIPGAIILCAALAAPARAESPPRFETAWGRGGSEPGLFDLMAGLALDGRGYVYVTDLSSHRIQKFRTSGTLVAAWGSEGTGDGELNGPAGIACDAGGHRVYVTDTNNHRVVVFSDSGAFVATWGSAGNGPGQFNHPRAVALDSGGSVLVADTDNHRVQRFSPGGDLQTTWGWPGSGDGQLNEPRGIAVGPDGSVYVADTGNERIQKFTADGAFLSRWGSPGEAPGSFQSPCGIAVDGAGNVYVAEALSHRIQKFTPAGGLLSAWGANGYWGDMDLFQPIDVDVDPEGTIYVADSGNARVKTFVPCDPNCPPEPVFFRGPPKLLVHLGGPTAKNGCGSGRIHDPTKAVTRGGLAAAEKGPFHFAYILAVPGEVKYLSGLQLGVDYDSGSNAPASGVDVFEWKMCATMEFPAGSWPGPGSSNLITWDRTTSCQAGAVAVAGYLYLAAYSPDSLAIIPRPVDGAAKVCDCENVEWALAPEDLGVAVFSAGAAKPGCNPCLEACKHR